jgi:mono/diheme cytochrome c family protein
MALPTSYCKPLLCLALGVSVFGLGRGPLPDPAATEAAPVEGKKADVVAIRPYLEQHCIACHGEAKPQGGLRLDNLAADFDNGDIARTWQKVFDRVQAGEMPPKTRKQPAADDTKKALAWVHDQLLAADRRAQPPVGALVLRRLNRVQYENTVRDLLDIDLELQERLPPDTRAFGFDNVGAALRLSSAQVEAYLDAADAALDASIVNRARPEGLKVRSSGLQALSQYNIRQHGGLLELEEAAVGFGRLEFYAVNRGIPEEGRYRVRASIFTYKSPEKLLDVYVRMRHTTGDRVIGYYQAPPDVPGVIEFVTTRPTAPAPASAFSGSRSRGRCSTPGRRPATAGCSVTCPSCRSPPGPGSTPSSPPTRPPTPNGCSPTSCAALTAGP